MAVNWEQALGSIGMMLSAMENPQQALLMGQNMADRNTLVAARKRREAEQAAAAQQQQFQNQLAMDKFEHQKSVFGNTQSQQQIANQLAADNALRAQQQFEHQKSVFGNTQSQQQIANQLAADNALRAQQQFEHQRFVFGNTQSQQQFQNQLATDKFGNTLNQQNIANQLAAAKHQLAVDKAAQPPPRRFGAQEGYQYDLDTGERVIPSQHVMSLQEAKDARANIAQKYGGTLNETTGQFSLSPPAAAKVNRAEQVNAAYIKAGASRTDAMAATLYEMNFKGATIEDVSEHVRKLVDARLARKAAGEDISVTDEEELGKSWWEKSPDWAEKLKDLFNPIADLPE